MIGPRFYQIPKPRSKNSIFFSLSAPTPADGAVSRFSCDPAEVVLPHQRRTELSPPHRSFTAQRISKGSSWQTVCLTPPRGQVTQYSVLNTVDRSSSTCQPYSLHFWSRLASGSSEQPNTIPAVISHSSLQLRSIRPLTVFITIAAHEHTC